MSKALPGGPEEPRPMPLGLLGLIVGTISGLFLGVLVALQLAQGGLGFFLALLFGVLGAIILGPIFSALGGHFDQGGGYS